MHFPIFSSVALARKSFIEGVKPDAVLMSLAESQDCSSPLSTIPYVQLRRGEASEDPAPAKRKKSWLVALYTEQLVYKASSLRSREESRQKDRHLEQKSILSPSSQSIRRVSNEENEACYVGSQFYKTY